MAFDAEKFMNSTVDPMATQFTVCPEGEFPFIIDSDPKQLIPKHLEGISQKNNQPYSFDQLEFSCLCQDQNVLASLKRDKVVVRLRVNLDLTAAGDLEVGQDKNVGLGRLRAALDQNKPGWNPRMLLGAGPFIGKVEHSQVKDATYADIVRVAKIS